MPTNIHGFGPNGELSPGATAALAGLGGGGGVTDHGALTGLGDDDHTQYHTDARGDARYYTKGQVDSLVTSGSGGAFWGNIHAHATANMVFGNAIVEPAVFLFAGDSITADGKWDEYFEDRIAREYTPGTAKTHAKISTYTVGDYSRPTAAGVYGYDLAQNAIQSGAYMRSGLLAAFATDFQPQLIFHGIGSNDHIAGLAPATTTANIDAACLELDAVLDAPSIHVIWAGMSPTDASRAYPWQQRVEAMKAAADLDPTRRMFVDLGPYFDALGTGTASDWWDLSADALHMDTRAQYMFAELMHRALHGSPPVGVLGPSPSPALPYSGTTTTTTTAATTTTTTTEATTTTTTTEATTTTTTTAAAPFEYLDSARISGTGNTTHTFTGMDFGAESASRTIIVGVAAQVGYPTDVTIGGVTATMDVKREPSGVHASLWRATVPTGTTGNVVVTTSNTNTTFVSVGVWRASGAVTTVKTGAWPGESYTGLSAGDFIILLGVTSASTSLSASTLTGATSRFIIPDSTSVSGFEGSDHTASTASHTATYSPTITSGATAAYRLT